MSGDAVEIVAWQVSDIKTLGVSAEQCSAALQFVGTDGAVASGSDAVGETLRLGSFPWSLAGRILLLPGVRTVAGAAYRWVARNRHRFGPRSVGKR